MTPGPSPAARRWQPLSSIRSRLLALVALVSVPATVTFAVIALVAEHRAANDALVAEQATLAALVANASAAALVVGDDAVARDVLASLGAVAHLQAACLYGDDNALFAGHARNGAVLCPATYDAATIIDAPGMRTAVPVRRAERVGTLLLIASDAPLAERRRALVARLAIAAVLATALALALALLLEPRISGPIRRLGAVAESIDGTGDTALRARIEHDDEIGQLAGAFNRMLDRLDEQTRRLKLQAEYNEVLFKRSPLPVVVIDPGANRLVDCNEAAVAIYGLGSREATLDSTAATVSAPLQYDGTPSERAIVPIVEAALAGTPQVYDWRHRRPDGSEFDAEVHLTRFGPEDAPLLLGSLLDVTERKAATAALRQLNEVLEDRVDARTRDLADSNAELSAAVRQLRMAQGELVRSERLASLGAMVAGIAHELNTPLGSALLVATTLGDGIDELRGQLQRGELKRSTLEAHLTQQAEAQALIVRNARRAAELIGRFKQVAVDQTSEQRRRFDLAQVVHEVLGTLQPRLRKSPHRLAVDVPAGLAMDSYPGPLGQVLTNLVMNALLHGLDALGDGRVGTIRVQARALPGDHVELAVLDDGVGIAPEHLPRIFDPFFTTRLGEGGSGLGLHIVYSLVQRSLGGRIAVDSAPGRGTRFLVTVPRVGPQADAA